MTSFNGNLIYKATFVPRSKHALQSLSVSPTCLWGVYEAWLPYYTLTTFQGYIASKDYRDFTLGTIEHRLLIYKAIVEKHCPRILNSEHEQRNTYWMTEDSLTILPMQ